MTLFKLETEDLYEFQTHLNGPRAISAIRAFAEVLRGKCKYESTPPDGWHEVQNIFLDHCGEILAAEKDW